MNKPTVLVVDDCEVNQLLICKILEKLDIHFDIAFNGGEAIKKVTQNTFNLIFMDIQMPGMDGYQAVKVIRQTTQGRELPIIAVTAHNSPDDEKKCLKGGMDGFITKPVDARQIIEIIERFLSHNQADESLTGQAEENPSQVLFDKLHQDISFMQKLVEQFSISAEKLMEDLRLAIDVQNDQAVFAHAHALKGLSTVIEAHHAAQLFEKVEHQAKLMIKNNMLVLLKEIELELEFVVARHHAFIVDKSLRD